MALLEVSGVSKKENEIFIVKNISFAQESFQKIAIAGETGSGKTTLLKMIGGLIQPDSGEIIFGQKKVRGPNYQLIPGEPGIAYLGQHFELRNNYRVQEILSYANELTQQAADNLYAVCRINHLLSRRTDQLSGGEKQRIALARLLIGSPRLLLLDEPFSNLDAMHRQTVKSVINDINAKLGISCMMISHDPADIFSWADTMLVMKDGELVQQGSPKQVYRQPADEYCAGILGEYNLVDAASAALLNPSTIFLSNQKKILVRPEEIIIDTSGEGLEGIVQQVFFMGSYYMVEVKTSSMTMKIKTAANKYIVGETVRLSTGLAER
ncbi:MAG: ABC transporter ATP-binding protein [Bacteroidota bacterium]